MSEGVAAVAAAEVGRPENAPTWPKQSPGYASWTMAREPAESITSKTMRPVSTR